jgi:hypothetical protein
MPLCSQGLLKRVTNSIASELPGKPKQQPNAQPEPECACDPAELILELGGKYQINYTEMSISVNDDGSVLIKDLVNGDFYIVKGQAAEGPIKEGDPRLKAFDPKAYDSKESMLTRFKEYITKSGDKHLITFQGKSYGPYADISSFIVNRSKDRFVATVTEDVVVTESDMKKMETAMKNAKTDQEKMEIAMQYGQLMQQNMMKDGNPANTAPQVISNIPGAKFDPMYGGAFNNKIKYDDIVNVRYDCITDLTGKKLIAIKQEHAGAEELFLNSSNTKYAVNDYGALTFSDNTKLAEIFNPHLVKTDGKMYLAYMYYSPKRNAIMQCKIPF